MKCICKRVQRAISERRQNVNSFWGNESGILSLALPSPSRVNCTAASCLLPTKGPLPGDKSTRNPLSPIGQVQIKKTMVDRDREPPRYQLVANCTRDTIISRNYGSSFKKWETSFLRVVKRCFLKSRLEHDSAQIF